MKVIAFNGSPKKDGNTAHGIGIVKKELEAKGIDVKVIHVGNKQIRGCMACNQCVKNRDEKCVIQGDEVNEWIQEMKDADGIILGSPVFYSAIAGTMKAFLDRAFYVTSVNNMMLRHKVGASVVAVRRSGGLPTFNQLNNYINYSEMMMPTSNYWHVIHGTTPGEALKDDEGIQIMEVLGRNMAYMLEMRDQSTVEPPAPARKKFTNFIR